MIEKKYGLKYKDDFDFLLVSNTLEELDEKIYSCFHSWKRRQSTGNNSTIEDFLSQFVKVEIIIDKCNDEAAYVHRHGRDDGTEDQPI